ncbi:hypothetical protein Angca_009650, partial [Angiostrongylus cantonensis]
MKVCVHSDRMRMLSTVTTLVLVIRHRLCDGGAAGTSDSLDNAKMKAIVEKGAKQYLAAFGYMSQPKALNDGSQKSQFPNDEDLKTALLRFQKAFLLYQSGTMDVPTQSKMSEYRCGNKDMSDGQQLRDLPKTELWRKRALRWSITSFPLFLTNFKKVLIDLREACDEAFEKWRQVAHIDFLETNNATQADIVILFDALSNPFLNVAATSSAPLNSWIILNKNLLWGYRNHIPSGISLYHTLLHEIGHTLGLQHNFYRGSIMYPMLKLALIRYGSLEKIPDVDKLSLRRLYGLANINGKKLINEQHMLKKCPKQIDSVLRVTKDEWMVFYEKNVYRIKGRKFVDNGKKIQDVFPKAPGFVNATVTSSNLILLFVERTIYGYEYDGVTFSEAPDFPRELHERVLFYPEAAFPLTNGSVILLSGNVFAAYSVLDNVPTFLNDKTRYFPNLPHDLRSGVLENSRNSNRYWMFDEKTVADYDMRTKQVSQITSITDFFKC